MKRFKKWRDTDPESTGENATHSTNGTPLGATGEDFQAFMSDVDGFERGADAYVYAVALYRRMDGSRWYYVGQTTGGETGLESRLKKHVRGEMTKTVQRDGLNILDSPLQEDTRDEYVVVGISRAEPVTVTQPSLLRARVLEREREMAYEMALENKTTNVLGGA